VYTWKGLSLSHRMTRPGMSAGHYAVGGTQAVSLTDVYGAATLPPTTAQLLINTVQSEAWAGDIPAGGGRAYS